MNARAALDPVEQWMQTAYGRKFVLTAPTPEMVDFKSEVPEHLSRIARLNGAVSSGIYSVAQHCVIGCDALYDVTRDPTLAAYFLTHDSHEAYIGDIITPVVKALAAIEHEQHGTSFIVEACFAELKRRIDVAIHAAARLTYPLPPQIKAMIKHYDARMLATERLHLMAPRPAAWASDVEEVEPLPLRGKLTIWPWPRAADEYRSRLARFLPHVLD